MRMIGVTGNIGAGKTTVCEMLRAKGIPVYYTDEVAKRLTADSPSLRNALRHILAGAEPDKATLSRIIFGEDSSEKRDSEAAIHAAVFADLRRWENERRDEGHPLCLVESALLPTDCPPYEPMWAYLLVSAPETVRLCRVAQRTGWDEADIRRRMACQSSEEAKRKHCQYEIVNDGLRDLPSQVDRFLLWATHATTLTSQINIQL
jgi:dephospho-CoA kinase